MWILWNNFLETPTIISTRWHSGASRSFHASHHHWTWFWLRALITQFRHMCTHRRLVDSEVLFTLRSCSSLACFRSVSLLRPSSETVNKSVHNYGLVFVSVQRSCNLLEYTFTVPGRTNFFESGVCRLFWHLMSQPHAGLQQHRLYMSPPENCCETPFNCLTEK